MTTPRDLDRLMEAFLEDGPSVMTDRVAEESFLIANGIRTGSPAADDRSSRTGTSFTDPASRAVRASKAASERSWPSTMRTQCE